ncbi:hypothetical protein FB446DRAFT_761144 [Lentinula raphanica]|nr:hypothetical protein FB446DRAFT_761144 [Lentinula raphanica]
MSVRTPCGRWLPSRKHMVLIILLAYSQVLLQVNLSIYWTRKRRTSFIALGIRFLCRRVSYSLKHVVSLLIHCSILVVYQKLTLH